MVGPRSRVLLTLPLVTRVLHPVTIIFIFNIVLSYNDIYGSVQSIAYATLFWHIVVLRCNFEECAKIWPSLSPPCEVDHNYKQSRLVSLLKKKMRRLHYQLLGSSEFLSWRLTPADRCTVFPPQSNFAFINSKNCSALRFPFSAHRITSGLNFAVYDTLFDFWHPSSITTVHDKLE
jgi:hypothetical protein